ncbi:hypothetical protein MTO96_019029 [Rhipicephalus appendiculatus]
MFKHVAFVRAVEQQEHVAVASPQSAALNGESARKFYDDVVSQPSTSVDVVEPVTATGAGRDRGRQTSLCHPVKPLKVSEYFIAAQRNDIVKLERCLRSGIAVDVTDVFGWTALMCAACDGAADSVRYLLQNGASKCLVNAQGKTAVELAAQRGRVEVVELLCKSEKLSKNATIQSTERQDDDSRRDPTQLCRVCDRHFSSSEKNTHEASILHQFNVSRHRAPGVTHYGISESNTGFQMLLGMGWDRNKGFGPREQGRKFPVKTVLRRNRSGLGAEVPTPRVTHFAPHDRAAVENNSRLGGKAPSLKRKLKEQESHSLRMRQMEIEFRRSFH